MKTQRADLDALTVWALATFHASVFLLVGLVFLYWQDVLRNVLPNLNTLVGLGLFAVLWAVTWWTTRHAFAALDTDAGIVRAAARWGGVNGVLFLWLAGLGVVGALLVTEPGIGGALAFGAFVLVIGSLVAFAVGVVVGTVLGALDLVLLKLARRLVRDAVGADTAPREELG